MMTIVIAVLLGIAFGLGFAQLLAAKAPLRPIRMTALAVAGGILGGLAGNHLSEPTVLDAHPARVVGVLLCALMLLVALGPGRTRDCERTSPQ